MKFGPMENVCVQMDSIESPELVQNAQEEPNTIIAATPVFQSALNIQHSLMLLEIVCVTVDIICSMDPALSVQVDKFLILPGAATVDVVKMRCSMAKIVSVNSDMILSQENADNAPMDLSMILKVKYVNQDAKPMNFGK